jgi:hypothetical protein
MRVICAYNEFKQWNPHLTKGKIYDVVDMLGEYYFINDNGDCCN